MDYYHIPIPTPEFEIDDRTEWNLEDLDYIPTEQLFSKNKKYKKMLVALNISLEPESSLSYFPFERVEDGEEDNPGDSTEDEGFYGTIYYSLEDQIYNKNKSDGDNVGEVIEELEDLDIKQTTTTNKTQEGFEEDEELNNLVLSIIDDE